MSINPRVGVGVIIRREGKVLFGKRKGSHGAGCWALPGGHLEFGESIVDCAKREVFEELGLKILDVKIATFTNDIFIDERKHYITIFTIHDYNGGEIKNLEPEKCSEWKWFEWSDLPENLFLPIKNLLKTSFDPFGFEFEEV